MMQEDYEEARDASAPIDMLETYFQAHGWTCDRVAEDEIVATVQGSWTQYELRGVWRPEDRVLQFLALPDIRVPPDKRGAVYETIGLINEQLWLGHFELWASSGLALYRNATLIEADGESVMGIDHAETLIETAIDECERFYPVFQFVLWGDKSPAEAIAAALIETRGEA
ncbi:MAG TPA: YbjN domain-containing protein [Sphingomonas sp.]